MKNLYKVFALAATVAAFASCSKEETYADGNNSSNVLSLTVGNETKTILYKGTQVNWSSSDKLMVFDSEKGFQFTTTASNVPSAVFTCENYTGGVPLMAVHTCTSACSGSAYDGVKTVTSKLNFEQKIYHKASYSKEAALAVGKISGEESNYSVEAMKQCFALLQFSLLDTSIVSITMKGNNNEDIAGWVDIDYDAVAAGNNFWTVNTAKGGAAKEISLSAYGSACKVKGNGAFADTSYCVTVLPQTLSKGLTFVFTRRDGKSATREITSSVTLDRAKIKMFAHPVDSGLVFGQGNLKFIIDKAQWPFKEACVAKASQSKTGTSGEKYTYKYSSSKTAEFEIANPAGESTGYAFSTDKFLKFGDTGHKGWIKLPAIESYKLVSLSVTISNTSDKNWDLRPSLDGEAIYTTGKHHAETGSSITKTFEDDGTKTAVNTPYYMYLINGNKFQMLNLTAVYAPVEEE